MKRAISYPKPIFTRLHFLSESAQLLLSPKWIWAYDDILRVEIYFHDFFGIETRGGGPLKGGVHVGSYQQYRRRPGGIRILCLHDLLLEIWFFNQSIVV